MLNPNSKDFLADFRKLKERVRRLETRKPHVYQPENFIIDPAEVRDMPPAIASHNMLISSVAGICEGEAHVQFYVYRWSPPSGSNLLMLDELDLVSTEVTRTNVAYECAAGDLYYPSITSVDDDVWVSMTFLTAPGG
jgi:hypothetical protein